MILIGLGANIPSSAGTPDVTLRAALAELALYEIHVIEVSRIFRSPAWPNPRDPEYANAVANIETRLDPERLMARLHETETVFGRKRSARNAPRTLDLDLIDYNGMVMEGPPTLPHPRTTSRNFVLIPLRDVAPGWRHPVNGETVDTLLAALPVAERSLSFW